MSLFKMLIVDDEALARYAFRTLISKNFLNIDIVGEAESGNQAVEMVRKLKPDLIAMDIKMPGINGLEAAEEILNLFPDTNIIILTAYDNFDYIQKALDIGIKGYLLKPFKRDDVIEKINKVLSGIDRDKERTNISEQVESKIQLVKPFLEKELVAAIAGRNTNIEEIKSYMNFLQGNINSGYFMLVSIGQCIAENINDSVRNKILKEKVQGVIRKHLPHLTRCLIGGTVSNSIVTFIILDDGIPEKTAMSSSMQVASELKRRIKVITGLDSAIGIGKPYADIKKFKESFSESNIALNNAIKDNEIVHFDSVGITSLASPQEYPAILENEMIEELRIGNFTRVRELMADIINNITGNCTDIDILKEYMSMLIVNLKRTALQLGAGIDSLAKMGLMTGIDTINERDELVFWCKTSMLRVIEIAEEQKQNKEVSKIKKVHDFINKNLSRNITLEMAADEAGLTPQYFSKLFKEETGENFVEYLTEKRMNFARHLMKSTNKSIKEISTMVGYSDFNYFCRLFKKVTGRTPRHYKESI